MDIRQWYKKMKSQTNKDGQALTEFIVGLVAIMVLVAGLVQIASITKAHTDAMFSARKEAGQLSMQDGTLLSASLFIKDWKENDDEKRYTKDDSATTDSLMKFNNDIVEYASDSADGWSIMNNAKYDAIPNLRNSTGVQFGMVRGNAGSSVDLLPIFQKLIYAAPEIDLECTVWMTWTKGIY